MAVKRKYPVGIQSFQSLRQDEYINVEKTQLFPFFVICYMVF